MFCPISSPFVSLNLPLRKARRKARRKHLCEKTQSSLPKNPADRNSFPLSTHKMSNTAHNNNPGNNNNNSNNTRTNGTQACAACKYQRRKCASDCILAPYFPHNLHHQFVNAHKLFGVSNITKTLRPLTQAQKDQAMISIKFESDVRASDPVGGSCRIIHNLHREIEFAYAELDLVMQRLAICRAAAASDPVSLICDLDPQAQSQAVGTESENVPNHCDSLINNNVEDHASETYKAGDEAISPLLQQVQPKPPVEDTNDATIQCERLNNKNPENQLYLPNLQHLEEINEEEDGGIGKYFLEGDDDSIDEINNDVILSLQDMEDTWDMQDALAYCLHDKEGFVNECKDLKPSVPHTGDEKLELKYFNHEHQLFEQGDEAISKDNKVIVQEETISKDEKPILREDFVTINDQSHDLKRTATLLSTA